MLPSTSARHLPPPTYKVQPTSIFIVHFILLHDKLHRTLPLLPYLAGQACPAQTLTGPADIIERQSSLDEQSCLPTSGKDSKANSRTPMISRPLARKPSMTHSFTKTAAWSFRRPNSMLPKMQSSAEIQNIMRSHKRGLRLANLQNLFRQSRI
jgi:hypothetical protein